MNPQEYPKWFKDCLKHYEFGIESRGKQYLASISRYPRVREEGIAKILKLIGNLDHKVILDVFGGNGYLTKVAKSAGIDAKIITNDISLFMASSSVDNGNATTLQPAENLFLIIDNCIDVIVMAYGVHHLPIEKRQAAFREAYRVLKDGGRMIVHDFTNDSKMANFFREVVDRYSLTGHDHGHFDREETSNLLEEIGFETSVHLIKDDFVFRGTSEKKVLDDCAMYFYLMYALEKLGDINSSETRDELLKNIKDILGMDCSYKDKQYECRVFRKAIVFVGDKKTRVKSG